LWVHVNKPLEPSKLPPCKYINDWTAYTLQLVELNDFLRAILPPTDSRIRPDRLALENLDVPPASAEKHALEEKQREDKRKRGNKPWVPKYFKSATDEDGDEVWEYIGGYFEEREKRVQEYYEKNPSAKKKEEDNSTSIDKNDESSSDETD